MLFSAHNMIKKGKNTELLSINKANTAFPVNKAKVFISIKSKIKFIDINEKKIVK